MLIGININTRERTPGKFHGDSPKTSTDDKFYVLPLPSDVNQGTDIKDPTNIYSKQFFIVYGNDSYCSCISIVLGGLKE